MPCCDFACGNDAHTYHFYPTQYQRTSLDMHTLHYSYAGDGNTIAESSYGAEDCSWSESGSEGGEYVYSNNGQPMDGSITGDYRQPYNEYVYSHHYPNSGVSTTQSSFLPGASTSYSPITPQFEAQSVTSSNISSSFMHAIGQPPSYDSPSLSYSCAEEEKSNMMFADTLCDDMIPDDAETYHDVNDSPGGVWMPEMNQDIVFVQPNTFPENYEAASTSRPEESGFWTKEMQYPHMQQTPDEALLQQWVISSNPQDPSAYYHSYPAGIGCSYPTHLSADTSNTPSDFTSSESPLSPLEFETCHSDVSSTISPDAHLAPLPAFTSSSVLPARNLPPIIHAPRPTRTIDSTYFERLIAASEISNDCH
ncbi:hypothetical protein C8R41DRAFT_925382 [Lentinula lateritia]|uniref:Uncharacterized protein n=1 Tax=Lentinula lateritia TaxID=40482 RepID=A0ABQ8V3F4_9AGAR|nr:hypothetical protein C8R41DRAFT_925382 [Lentinula lateritia]